MAPALAQTASRLIRSSGARAKAITEALSTARKARADGGKTDDERKRRAKAQGFDTDKVWYHSTLRPLDKFNPHGKFIGHSGVGGIHLTDSHEAANRFLDRYGDADWQGKPFQKNIIPVYVKHGKTLKRDQPFPSRLPLGAPLPAGYVSPVQQAGYDGLLRNDAINKRGKEVWHNPNPRNALQYQELILHDPSRVRSVFAQFGDDETVPELSRTTGGRVARAAGGGVHTGPIHSSVAGRTDHLPMHVPSGSYVLPADIVSAMGEGNTVAGFKIAKKLPRLFATRDRTKGKPYGAKGPPYGASGLPYGADSMPYDAVPPPHKAAGGATARAAVPIVAAGGELVYSPEEVMLIGNGSLDDGHKILDHFVTQMRAATVKTLSKLPGPRKD